MEVYLGFDAREPVASYVAAHSIVRRTSSPINIHYIKHRELRRAGLFSRPWVINGETGETTDLIDGKTFSTEFSHTRFLVPHLMEYKGWALFIDADVIFLSDIKQLFALCDDRYAAMCVKHVYKPANDSIKMDNRVQRMYTRKNWSSCVLWNCGHPANAFLTPEKVSFMAGRDLHSFSWLPDHLIGALPFTYNFIAGVSPQLPPERGGKPLMVHYSDGGPWFDGCQDVPYGQYWIQEFESWNRDGLGNKYCDIPTTKYEI